MIDVQQNFTVRLQEGEVFYAKRYHEPSGQAPAFAWPRPLQGALPRIIHNAWWMNSYTGPRGGGSIRFQSPEARRYIAWQLLEGDAVCFDYSKLVGFTKSIRLRTEFTLRLSAFAMNRLLFPIALGPGLLLMQSVGTPAVTPDQQAFDSQSPSRLVCWSADTVFSLEAQSGLLNDYLSPVYLRPIQSKAVVVEADERLRHAPGILERIRRIAFPRG